MDEELKNLEKEFILDQNAKEADVKALIRRILAFWKIDQNGHVVIDVSKAKKLITLQKVMLILSARYLANRLQSQLGSDAPVPEQATIHDVADILREQQKIVGARISDLNKQKKILVVSRGIYKVAPYAVEPFLREIEDSKNG